VDLSKGDDARQVDEGGEKRMDSVDGNRQAHQSQEPEAHTQELFKSEHGWFAPILERDSRSLNCVFRFVDTIHPVYAESFERLREGIRTLRRKQSGAWSLTMPTACIQA